MLKFVPLVFLCGCVSLHNPEPIETEFNDDDRNWVEIYRNEIKIAVENQDKDAYHFFMFELLKERVRIKRINEKSNTNSHPK